MNMNEQQMPAEIYRQFYTNWLNQDRLMWGRVQWIMTIEIAIIAGAMQHPNLLGCLGIVVGTLLIILLWNIRRKDEADWQHCLKHMDTYHRQQGFPDLRVLSKPNPPWRSGRILIRITFVIVLLVNASLFIGLLLRYFGLV
jgi:uncharacterized iron-regulated membrane protein